MHHLGLHLHLLLKVSNILHLHLWLTHHYHLRLAHATIKTLVVHHWLLSYLTLVGVNWSRLITKNDLDTRICMIGMMSSMDIFQSTPSAAKDNPVSLIHRDSVTSLEKAYSYVKKPTQQEYGNTDCHSCSYSVWHRLVIIIVVIVVVVIIVVAVWGVVEFVVIERVIRQISRVAWVYSVSVVCGVIVAVIVRTVVIVK